MSAKRRFLAFDLGASGGRATLGEWDGARLSCEVVYSFANEPVQVHDSIHWDLLRLFHEVKRGLAVSACRVGGRVDGIGIDTWGVDFGLLDRTGRLLSNPLHHRDPRFGKVVDELKSTVGGYETYRDTGVMIEQVATITQLFALAREDSPLTGCADRFLMIPSLLNYFLTGNRCDEYSSLSNTGVIGCRDGKPLAGALERMGIRPGLVPEPARTGSVLGELLPVVRTETGISSGPVIACATHDTASAVVSVPASGTDWAFLSCGTWSVLGVETDHPVTSRESYDAGLTTAATADGRFMTRKNLTGLWILQELRRVWSTGEQTLDYRDMVTMAESAPAFAAFIDVDDPRFVHPADMSQAITDYLRESGQQVPQSRNGILRCVLESMAMKYRTVVAMIRSVTGAKIGLLHIVGGGVNNRLLCQLTADALGIPVTAGPVEATSMGNILVQMMGSGEIASVSEGRDVLRSSFGVAQYLPGNSDDWSEQYQRFVRVTEARTTDPVSGG